MEMTGLTIPWKTLLWVCKRKHTGSTMGTPTFLSFTTGFPHYHKACYCCFFLGKGEEVYEEIS